MTAPSQPSPPGGAPAAGGPHGRVPVLGFVAPSGTGKTTLLTKVIPILRRAGLKIGAVKHSHHGFDLDRPGKDSYRLREAGVQEMLLVSAKHWALLVDEDENDVTPLEEVVKRLYLGRLDVVLVEGYRGTEFPKIELRRHGTAEPPLYPKDPSVIAVATDGDLPEPTGLPVLPISDPEAVAAFVLDFLRRR